MANASAGSKSPLRTVITTSSSFNNVPIKCIRISTTPKVGPTTGNPTATTTTTTVMPPSPKPVQVVGGGGPHPIAAPRSIVIPQTAFGSASVVTKQENIDFVRRTDRPRKPKTHFDEIQAPMSPEGSRPEQPPIKKKRGRPSKTGIDLDVEWSSESQVDDVLQAISNDEMLKPGDYYDPEATDEAAAADVGYDDGDPGGFARRIITVPQVDREELVESRPQGKRRRKASLNADDDPPYAPPGAMGRVDGKGSGTGPTANTTAPDDGSNYLVLNIDGTDYYVTPGAEGSSGVTDYSAIESLSADDLRQLIRASEGLEPEAPSARMRSRTALYNRNRFRNRERDREYSRRYREVKRQHYSALERKMFNLEQRVQILEEENEDLRRRNVELETQVRITNQGTGLPRSPRRIERGYRR